MKTRPWRCWWDPKILPVLLCVAASCLEQPAWPSSAQPAGLTNASIAPASTFSLANRRVVSFRASLDGYTPEERVAAAGARLKSVMARADTLLVSTRAVPAGIQILLDGKALFVLTPGDVEEGKTLESETESAVSALDTAMTDLRSFRTGGEVFWAVAKACFGFGLFAGLLWTTRRAKRWSVAHITVLVAEKTQNFSFFGLRIAGLRSFVVALRALLGFANFCLVTFLVYALLFFELRCFPYSRPWGDFLRAQCISALRALGNGILDGLPGVMVMALIIVSARMFAQVLGRLFASAEAGEIKTHLLDPATAATTRRLLVFLVWVIAAVVAYPYIPGSQSLAFKGVTVFAGLVLSLGSTNLVSQAASGLLLIYSRAFRAGDYVRVGTTEGTVESVGICVTLIRTIQNEEVQVANSLLLSMPTTNYSRLKESDGLWLATKVTIGYSVPWRQVQGLLLEAANRTPGLVREPPPFVLQTNLSDFYVEYQLNARLEKPVQRAWVLSALHSQIQDAFNEHGVQIMSPHYFQDPGQPQVVPKSKWFLAPGDETSLAGANSREEKPQQESMASKVCLP